jgi:hypothetical protein
VAEQLPGSRGDRRRTCLSDSRRCAIDEPKPCGFAQMPFKIVGEIRDIQPIALGRSIRVRARLRKLYGGMRWRKLKGIADVRFSNGSRRVAEVHWYESHGVGRREIKIKRLR